MRKEILEQPSSIERMLRGRLDDRFGTARLDGLNLGPRELRGFRRVKILGCGSAYYVGQIGAAMIEELARVPADAEPASEFRYRNPIIEPDTLYVAVSQSGRDRRHRVRRAGGQAQGRPDRRAGQCRRLDHRPGMRRRDLPARRARGRGRLDQGPHAHGASGSRCSRWPSAGSATCPSPMASGSSPDYGTLPGQIQEIIADEPHIAEVARGLAGAREPVLHRPGPRLPGRARGRPEIQGDLLPARRGLPGQRAQARAAGADRREPADRGDPAGRRAHRPQPRARCSRSRAQRAACRHHPSRRADRRAGHPGSRCPRTSASSTRSC